MRLLVLGGGGTEDALKGAEKMSAMLAGLIRNPFGYDTIKYADVAGKGAKQIKFSQVALDKGAHGAGAVAPDLGEPAVGGGGPTTPRR